MDPHLLPTLCYHGLMKFVMLSTFTPPLLTLFHMSTLFLRKRLYTSFQRLFFHGSAPSEFPFFRSMTSVHVSLI